MNGSNSQIKNNDNKGVGVDDMTVDNKDKNVDNNYNKKMKNLNLSGIKKSKTPNINKSLINNNKNNYIKYDNNINDGDNTNIKLEQNEKNIFTKKNKKGNCLNNNIYKMFQKDPTRKTEKSKDKSEDRYKNNNSLKNVIPYLNYLQLNKTNKVDKINDSTNSKNNNLYNSIIKPYKSSVTLFHNSKKRKIKSKRNGYDNINYDINQLNNLNNRIYVFDLPNTTKNKEIHLNNSCFFKNVMKLGKVNYIHRSKSAFIGACFACDLGFAVSISGYSPMTFSPYDHVTKREACGLLPKSVVYEQYTRHKKSKFYKI
jgi:hypothetical protein